MQQGRASEGDAGSGARAGEGRDAPTTVGSRSMKTVRGTCLPEPVSEKKVLNASSPPPIVLSDGIWPSGWMPCSRQKSSQHALPVWMPAWPRWRVMHSRCGHGEVVSRQRSERVRSGVRSGRVRRVGIWRGAVRGECCGEGRSAVWGAGARVGARGSPTIAVVICRFDRRPEILFVGRSKGA